MVNPNYAGAKAAQRADLGAHPEMPDLIEYIDNKKSRNCSFCEGGAVSLRRWELSEF